MSPARSSDPGLAAERTSLAWSRLGMSLLAVPGAMLGWAAGHSWAASGAAAFAALLGLAILTLSLRGQRVDPDQFASGIVRLAAEEVVLAGSAVVLLCVAGIVLLT